MDFLFNSVYGVLLVILIAGFGYVLLIKVISKIYHWIKWQRMNPTERKYEKIRQQRSRDHNANSKKSNDSSPYIP
ncbi:MAG TPA: hypothetical protein VNR38_14505 [Ureibacillus sp.]|nr:hypothetical protein [Ureibacillus sp.]